MSYIAIIDGNSLTRTIFEKRYRWFVENEVDIKHFKLSKYIAEFLEQQITDSEFRAAPKDIVFVFDTNVNYRKLVLESYKANRKPEAVHKFLPEMEISDFGKKGFSMQQLAPVKKFNQTMYDLMKLTSEEIKKDKTYKSKKIDNSDEVNLKIENFVNLWNSVVEEINEVKQEQQDAKYLANKVFKESLKEVQETLTKFNIHFYEKEGFEGDDLINSIINQYPDNNYLIFSGDADLNQLVSKNVARSSIVVKPNEKGLYKTTIFTMKDISENTLLEKTLCGDTSDNIPGIPGLGSKKCAELLKLGNSVDAILANPDIEDVDKELILTHYKDLVIYNNIITLKNIPVDLITTDIETVKTFVKESIEDNKEIN